MGGSVGLGVTAYSLEDAYQILETVYQDHPYSPLENVQVVMLDIDVSTLAKFVRFNMGPATFRGIWYPCLNLY